MTDPTRRFSDRAENYVRYRPSYPDAVWERLHAEIGLTVDAVIADVGSGTGLSTELFLRHGNSVFAVEPNQDMRQAAETLLQKYPQFHSVAGTAEDTTLPRQSMDCVVVGHAFHWFDPQKAKQEFARILRPGGWVVLMWNKLRKESTSFLQAYEALLLQYGTDYEKIRHVDEAALKTFFAEAKPKMCRLYNEQHFDFEGLKGRVLSSSFTPNVGHPHHEPMVQALKDLFEQHNTQGYVCFEYDLDIFLGCVIS
ncbi:MAG: class I SAM-dependent methyltransferase [Leptolyngbyaceae cyanobacterium]